MLLLHLFNLKCQRKVSIPEHRSSAQEGSFLITYTLSNLVVDGKDDPVDAAPVVFVFGPASDDTEALKDVDDVVNTSSFDSELFGALVQVKYALALDAVVVKKAAAEFAKALFLAVVNGAELGVGPGYAWLRGEECRGCLAVHFKAIVILQEHLDVKFYRAVIGASPRHSRVCTLSFPRFVDWSTWLELIQIFDSNHIVVFFFIVNAE